MALFNYLLWLSNIPLHIYVHISSFRQDSGFLSQEESKSFLTLGPSISCLYSPLINLLTFCIKNLLRVIFSLENYMIFIYIKSFLFIFKSMGSYTVWMWIHISYYVKMKGLHKNRSHLIERANLKIKDIFMINIDFQQQVWISIFTKWKTFQSLSSDTMVEKSISDIDNESYLAKDWSGFFFFFVFFCLF